ncbi:MAG: CinA family protein [Mycobacteriaceae bacterium]|nr:CinA family protein [Mycobacteriaceae bacterium]
MTTANEVGDLARDKAVTVAVAESLTAGNVAAALGAAPDSAEWFRGGIVAYSTEVKHQLLDVPDIPVVSEAAAIAMATSVRAMMGADVAVAVTGVGGPGPQDGEPAGSVWFAVATADGARGVYRRFDGGPARVVDRSVRHALELLLDAVHSAA